VRWFKSVAADLNNLQRDHPQLKIELVLTKIRFWPWHLPSGFSKKKFAIDKHIAGI
jgi:hypothetical protein